MHSVDDFVRRSSAGSGSAAWRQVYRSSKRREALRVVQFVLLGCSGWWSSNAIWSAEQPIYIEAFATSLDSNVTTANLPIATNLAVACQLGNVGPIVYNLVWSVLLPLCLVVCGASSTRGGAAFDAERPLLLASRADASPLQWDEAKARSEKCQRRAVLPTLGVCLLAAVGACLLAAFMWEQTMTVNGSEVHVWLLIAELIAGLTGCMSAVTFWSFTMRFSKSSVKALSVGLSIGSLFSQGLALVQQQGRSAASTRISVRDYLLTAAAVQLLFFLNFLLLVWSSAAELRAAARSPPRARLAAGGSDAYNYDDDDAELADTVGDGGAGALPALRHASRGADVVPIRADSSSLSAAYGSVAGGERAASGESREGGGVLRASRLEREVVGRGESAGAGGSFSASFRGALPGAPGVVAAHAASAESTAAAHTTRGEATFDSRGAGVIDLAVALASRKSRDGARGAGKIAESSSGGDGVGAGARGGAMATTVEMRVRIVVVFAIYAATYALPALQPYMVRSYQNRPDGFYSNLLLWMSNMQVS